MMKLEGENTLLRIFLDTFSQWHHAPLYQVIVERARKQNMAGATVLEALSGFGENGKILQESAWHLGNNRRVIVEIVDAEARIEGFLDEIEPMLTGTLVTLERAHVVHYRHREKP